MGSHVVDLLIQKGVSVRCLLRPGRSEEVLQGRPVEVARGDLRDESGLAEAVTRVDAVIHVAGLIGARSPAEFLSVNMGGTRRLARMVRASNPDCRRFVYVSSQAAAGPSPDGVPIDESVEPNPLTHYGRSKLAGERVLADALGPVPFTVLRPPAIYGPRDEALLPIFQLAAKGWTADLDGRGRLFNLLHADDVARGVVEACFAESAAGQTYFLSDGVGASHSGMARILGEAFGRRLRRIPVPDFLLDLVAALTDELAGLAGVASVFGRQKAIEFKARWWLCSAARAKADFGWEPRVPPDSGLVETARWYAEQGKLGGARVAASPV